MKKAIYTFAVISLFSMAVMPAIAASIGTSLSPDITGGTAPVVQAKWEANVDRYTDDSSSANAQFQPTGQYQQNKNISICAIVSDPDGIGDVKHVYADVFYPVGIAVGPDHVKLPSQTGSDKAGCGVLMQEDELSPLSKDDGYNLFCGATNSVRGSNNNLPTFGSGYNYEAICKADGTLQKEMAKVYCVKKEISYEDPSGSYEVKAVVVDTSGKSKVLSNHFTYLPMVSFETDFTNIAYGKVRLETEKIINGDLTWGPALASIRNVGNTRAAISVSQNDMNFGKTGLNWNVYYRARIGNNQSDWTQYDPEQTVTLKDELNLSELDEIDFAIYVKKFPITESDYVGTMTLGATSVPHSTDCSWL